LLPLLLLLLLSLLHDGLWDKGRSMQGMLVILKVVVLLLVVVMMLSLPPISPPSSSTTTTHMGWRMKMLVMMLLLLLLLVWVVGVHEHVGKGNVELLRCHGKVMKIGVGLMREMGRH